MLPLLPIPDEVQQDIIAPYLDLQELSQLPTFANEYQRRLREIRTLLSTNGPLQRQERSTQLEYLVSLDNPKVVHDLIAPLDKDDQREILGDLAYHVLSAKFSNPRSVYPFGDESFFEYNLRFEQPRWYHAPKLLEYLIVSHPDLVLQMYSSGAYLYDTDGYINLVDLLVQYPELRNVLPKYIDVDFGYIINHWLERSNVSNTELEPLVGIFLDILPADAVVDIFHPRLVLDPLMNP